MRDISPDFLNEALSLSKVIGARATIRDTRLIFDPIANVSTVVNGGTWTGDIADDRNFTFQSCVFDGKILRVGCFTYEDNVSYLIYHYALPTSEDWADPWQLVGSVTTMEDSQIGIWVDEGIQGLDDLVYVFYHSGSDKHIHIIEFDGLVWSGDYINLYTDGYKGSRLAIMPVNRNQFFLNVKRHGEPPDNTSDDNGVIYSQLLFINHLAGNYQLSTYLQSTAYILGSLFMETANDNIVPVQYNFQAIEHDGVFYIFAPEAASKKCMVYRFYFEGITDPGNMYSYGYLGNPKPLMPIDVVDDDIYFKFGGASVINNQLWVSGVFSRSYGKSMHIYTVGPDHWSMGRDIYIHGPNAGDNVIASPGGRLFNLGNKIYYVGAKEVYVSDSTYMTGYDDPTKKIVLEGDIIKANLGYSSNAVGSLTLEIHSSVNSSIIRRNSRVDLELVCNNKYENVGVFNISGVAKDQPGNIQLINCKSGAMKKIAQWIADASYDYWSQTKSAIELKAEGQSTKVFPGMVRGTGEWTGNSDKVWPITFGQDCILFSTEKACRASAARARFEFPEYEVDALFSKVGIVLNYYRETRVQAAQRLGKSESEVLDSEFGNNYLAIYLLSTENRFHVDQIVNNNVVATWASSDPEIGDPPIDYPTFNEKFWIMASFIEGIIEIHYRKDSAQEWSKIRFLNVNLDYAAMPWNRSDMVGRAGILIGSHTSTSSNLPFSATDKLIPVLNNMYFQWGDIVQVGDEFIQVGNKSGLEDWIEDVASDINTGSDDTAFVWPMYGGNLADENAYYRLFDALRGIYNEYGYLTKNDLPSNTTPDHCYKKICFSRTVPINCYPYGLYIPDGDGYGYINEFLSKIEYGPVIPGTANIDTTSKYYKSWNRYQYEQATQFYSLLPIYTTGYPTDSVFGMKMGVAFTFNDTLSNNTSWILTFPPDPTNVELSLYPVEFAAVLPTVHPDDRPPVDPTRMCKIEVLYKKEEPQDNLKIALHLDKTTEEIHDTMLVRQGDPNQYQYPIEKRLDGYPQTVAGADWYQLQWAHIGFWPSYAIYNIYPTYEVVLRGVFGSPVSYHPAGTLGGFAENPGGSSEFRPTCDRFEFYSTEMDMRLEDIIAEIAGKAGAQSVFEKAMTTSGTAYPGVITASSGSGYVEVGPEEVDKNNFIVKFQVPTFTVLISKIGIIARRSDLNRYLSLYFEMRDTQDWIFSQGGSNGGSSYTPEAFPYTESLCGKEITLSLNDNIVSLWVNERFWCSHKISPEFSDLTGTAKFFVHDIDPLGLYTNDINVDWSELCERVDNFILDMGYNGHALISDVITERRVFFQDDKDGNLHVFRNRAVINDGDPFINTISSRNALDDIVSATHILMDGIDIVEDFDEDLLKSDGRVFYYGNSERLDTKEDMTVELQKKLKDEKGLRSPYSIEGSIDPRIETNDVLECVVDEAGTEKQIVVSNVSFTISNAPEFDMSVEGYEYIP